MSLPEQHHELDRRAITDTLMAQPPGRMNYKRAAFELGICFETLRYKLRRINVAAIEAARAARDEEILDARKNDGRRKRCLTYEQRLHVKAATAESLAAGCLPVEVREAATKLRAQFRAQNLIARAFEPR